MDTPKTIREQISAFSDHELSPSTLPDDALRSAEGEHAWHAYHRIGDIIREQDAPHLSAGFADKLAARLAAEPLPGKRLLRASAEALARCAPVVPPAAVAVAAGAAGPVTGIDAVSGEAASVAASGISELPLDPDAQAVTEAPGDAADTLDGVAAAAAEASIAAGAEAVTIAVVKAAASGEARGSGAGDAQGEPNAGAALKAEGMADGMLDGMPDGTPSDPKAVVAFKPPITSVS